MFEAPLEKFLLLIHRFYYTPPQIKTQSYCIIQGHLKVKVKSLYLTLVVPLVTRLVSMEADGARFTPLPLSVLRFTGIQGYDYTDQGKVETDVKSLKIEPETSRSKRSTLAN